LESVAIDRLTFLVDLFNNAQAKSEQSALSSQRSRPNRVIGHRVKKEERATATSDADHADVTRIKY
jgi:hypothetical protein